MIDEIATQLEGFYPSELINSLLKSYEDLAGNYVRGKLGPSEVEGGRFCESVIRMLQYETTGEYTDIGVKLNLDKEIDKFRNLPQADFNDSLRLHIPRTLRVIYDIRNKRNSAHLGNINPNLMDAVLVLTSCKWVLAELFRTKFKILVSDAQAIIDSLVEKDIPLIQDFGGFPVILNPDLPAKDRILLLLYNRGEQGATRGELTKWLPPKMQKQISTNLHRLQHTRCFIHRDSSKTYLTISGEKYVEDNILPHL